jgi:murein DD-endopeptidase MepM/ murein hydrolase activator NlpD
MIKRTVTLLLTLVLLSSAIPAYAQTPTPPPGPVYIVQEGDSLWAIAARFGISVDTLTTANGLINGNIYPGDQIIIPGLEGINGTLTSQTVAFGENLRSVVRQYQFNQALLGKLNHIISPTELYAGAKLIVVKRDDKSALTAQANIGTGETLLELAVRQNTDPWTVVSLNTLSGTWDSLPDDVLYLPGGTSTARPTGLPAIFGKVEVEPLPLVQGVTAQIKITPTGDAIFGGTVVNMPLHFFPFENGASIALQGVHALANPGLYPLRLEATLSDGTTQSYEQMVLVASGGYPEDSLLYVDPSLIDPAVTEPELQQIVALVQPATADRLWNGGFISPASAYADSTYFTSRFGYRRTYIGLGTNIEVYGFHTGLDFGGGTGLPITAPAAGRVIFAGSLTVRGNATIIDHGWGVYSGFWHQSEIDVKVGDMIEKGQVIGLVGGTGRVTGPHLHWEIWVNGIQVDPLQWLNESFPH